MTAWTPPLFAWQAWHLLWHCMGWLWWRAWFPVDAVDAAAVCVAGVALGDMDSHFAWQVWHLATMDLHFVWQVWHLVTSTSTLHARQGAL